MMSRVLVAACVATFASSTAWAQWEDEERTQNRSASESVGSAPTGIMAVVNDNDDVGWDDGTGGDDEFEEAKSPVDVKRKRPRTEPRTQLSENRGIVVIEDNDTVSNVIIHGEPDPDRIGRSLGAQKSKGLSIGTKREKGEQSYRVRADMLDEEEEAVRTREEAVRRKKMKAPMGLVVPIDGRGGEDPWEDDSKAGIRRKSEGAHRSLLDDLSEPTTQTFESSSFKDVKPKSSDAREDDSVSSSVWGDEGENQVYEAKSVDEPVFRADESVAPEPERAKKSPRRAVGETGKKPEKILSYDPFSKLEGDLSGEEGKSDKEALPAYEVERPKAKQAPSPKYEAPKRVERGDDASRTGDWRDLSYWGFSALAGVGVNIAKAPVSGYTADLALGLNLRLQPEFTGPVALDLSFWRAARSDGTPVVAVDSAWSHISLRAFYVRDIAKGFFMGAGGGLLLTSSSASYVVNDGAESIATGGALRPGGEIGAIMGMRYKLFEARLDLRALVRGGLRLDFLPVVSFGVTL